MSDLQDTGERWLTFFIVSGLAVIAMMAALYGALSFYWAIAAAVPIGLAIGWIASGIRFMRRAILAIVDGLMSFVSAFT